MSAYTASAPKAKKVLFIRHGESQSNAGEKTEHPLSIKLTQTGVQQAAEAAQHFSLRPALIVTSKYIRTKQTAEVFLEKFGYVPQEEWDIHEFTFLSPAKYKGTTNLERKSHIEAYWKAEDPLSREEGAESFTDFSHRCKSTLDRIKNCPEGLTLAFSHGYVMLGLTFALEGKFDVITQETMRDFWITHNARRIPNCGQIAFIAEGGNLRLENETPPALSAETATYALD